MPKKKKKCSPTRIVGATTLDQPTNQSYRNPRCHPQGDRGGSTCNPRTAALVESHTTTVRGDAFAFTASEWNQPSPDTTRILTPNLAPKVYGVGGGIGLCGGIKVDQSKRRCGPLGLVRQRLLPSKHFNYSNNVSCGFDEFRVDNHICKLRITPVVRF